jgi:hypothetical protein
VTKGIELTAKSCRGARDRYNGADEPREASVVLEILELVEEALTDDRMV